jgi:phospholipid transport system substrate-binding protein
MNHSKSVFYFVGLFLVCLSSMAVAKVNVIKPTFDSAPHNVVQDTTQLVLDALNRGLDPVGEPEIFVEELSKILDPVIAFDYIARGVMGNYAKEVTTEQVSQFAKSFKLGLVNTYGSGMSNFSDLAIAVLPPQNPINDEERRTVVVQEISGGASANQVSYSMAKNNQGQWKMINVILNGINLGQTFRGQFDAEVKKNKGDVTRTINEWGQR